MTKRHLKITSLAGARGRHGDDVPLHVEDVGQDSASGSVTETARKFILIPFYLETRKRVICLQCRSKSDAT